MFQHELQRETFGERPILVKYKEGDNFNHRNTLSISRIARKLHFVPKFETDAVIGQKGALCRGLKGAGVGICMIISYSDIRSRGGCIGW